MKIIIVGCGKVGRSVAEQLSGEDHDIIVVDNDASRLRNLAKEIDVMVMEGNGISKETLLEAGCDETDLLIALTGNDEVNMLCCLVARKNGCSKTIARVRNPEYSSELQTLSLDLGISMIINPELTAAREIYRSLALPPSVSSESFTSGKTEIYSFKIGKDSILAGMPVKDIPARLRSNILVGIVERGDQAYIPDGNFVLQEKDIISVTGRNRDVLDFFGKIRIKSNKVKDVMVIGAGKVAFYLVRMARDSRIHFTLIENDKATCEYMAECLPRATIIHGNGSDQNLLFDEGLQDMDAFVALTGIDEENIILSLYAGSQAHLKTITKINRIEFDEVIASMDLDTIINPKRLTAENILRFVRAQQGGLGSNVETIHKLANGKVEALEFCIGDGFFMTDIPLKDIAFKKGVLVALIIRQNEAILPRGNDCIKKGDHLLVITTHKGFTSLKDTLKERSSL